MAYIPTQADIEMTLNAINGRVVWAVPSVGCVILLHHETNTWSTYMKSNPTEIETHNYEKIETNLNVLGYHEASAQIFGRAKNVDEVIVALYVMITKTEQENGLDQFWKSVRDTISNFLNIRD
jgi:hypothetical protein